MSEKIITTSNLREHSYGIIAATAHIILIWVISLFIFMVIT